MARELSIDGFKINDQSDCYVIAEIGHNHQGDLEQCKKMFTVAKERGQAAEARQPRPVHPGDVRLALSASQQLWRDLWRTS